MSILKSILHHYNKTTKSYDTLHPETEVAQVTDWNNGIVNTLASTALGSLVNTLTSDSLLAMMIQKVLTASGVRYSTGTNGYLCLGSFFANIIIQWGTSDAIKVGDDNYKVTQLFPVAVSTYLCGQATIFANKSSLNTNDWHGATSVNILNATPKDITFVIDTLSRVDNVNMSVGYVILAKSI